MPTNIRLLLREYLDMSYAENRRWVTGLRYFHLFIYIFSFMKTKKVATFGQHECAKINVLGPVTSDTVRVILQAIFVKLGKASSMWMVYC